MHRQVAAANRVYEQRVAAAKKVFDHKRAEAKKELDAAIKAAHDVAGQREFSACTRGVAVQRTRRKEKGPQARARKTANHGEEDEQNAVGGWCVLSVSRSRRLSV